MIRTFHLIINYCEFILLFYQIFQNPLYTSIIRLEFAFPTATLHWPSRWVFPLFLPQVSITEPILYMLYIHIWIWGQLMNHSKTSTSATWIWTSLFIHIYVFQSTTEEIRTIVERDLVFIHKFQESCYISTHHQSTVWKLKVDTHILQKYFFTCNTQIISKWSNTHN